MPSFKRKIEGQAKIVLILGKKSGLSLHSGLTFSLK